jgi:hypothetical protein
LPNPEVSSVHAIEPVLERQKKPPTRRDEFRREAVDVTDSKLKIDAAPKRPLQITFHPRARRRSQLLEHELEAVAVEIDEALLCALIGYFEAAEISPEL